MERPRPPDLKLERFEPIQISRLIGTIPDRSNIARPDLYEDLAKSFIHPFILHYPSGVMDLIGVGKSLKAVQTNALAHHAAPSERYGLDTGDLDDWMKLYRDDNKVRLKKHREIENWNFFETERLRIYHVIFGQDRKANAPVIYLRQNPNRWPSVSWVLSRNDAPHLGRATSQVRENPPESEHFRNQVVLGPVLVGCFSPEVTHTWVDAAGEEGYPSHVSDKRKNTMGSTQSIAANLRHADTLLESRFIEYFLGYLNLR